MASRHANNADTKLSSFSLYVCSVNERNRLLCGCRKSKSLVNEWNVVVDRGRDDDDLYLRVLLANQVFQCQRGSQGASATNQINLVGTTCKQLVKNFLHGGVRTLHAQD